MKYINGLVFEEMRRCMRNYISKEHKEIYSEPQIGDYVYHITFVSRNYYNVIPNRFMKIIDISDKHKHPLYTGLVLAENTDALKEYKVVHLSVPIGDTYSCHNNGENDAFYVVPHGSELYQQCKLLEKSWEKSREIQKDVLRGRPAKEIER